MATGSNQFTQKAIGKDCCAIGNIVRNKDVPKAMTDAFEVDPNEPLAERLLRALAARDQAGVEFRQIKSAALLVVHRESFTYVDLRVYLDRALLAQLHYLWELDKPLYRTHVRPKQYPLSGSLRPDKCRRETGHRLVGFGHVFAHKAEHNAADAEIRQHRQVFSGIVVATSEETPLAFDIHRIAWA